MVKIFQVGGAVRDEILGKQPKDYDYAVEAQSFDSMVNYLEESGYRIFLKTPEFFTVRAKRGAIVADFVLCRKDGQYKDGRHPESVEVGTIYDDLARRDFTMNAIAIDVFGNYYDPHGGYNHIQRRQIVCVGNPKDRFEEDGLRLIRAFRFSITLGFEIHQSIIPFLKSDRIFYYLRNVSVERIREELAKAFKHNTLRTIMALQKYPQLTEAIFDDSMIWLKPTMEKIR